MCIKVNKAVYKENTVFFTSIKTILIIATLYILTMTKVNDDKYFIKLLFIGFKD